MLVADQDPATFAAVNAALPANTQAVAWADPRSTVDFPRDREVAVLLCGTGTAIETLLQLVATARGLAPELVAIVLVEPDHGDQLSTLLAQVSVHAVLEKPVVASSLSRVLERAVKVYDTCTVMHRIEYDVRRWERIYSLRSATAQVAHDLKNPLSVITGNTELARWRIDELKDALPAQVADQRNVRDALAEIEVSLRELGHGVDEVTGVIRGFERASRLPFDEASCDLKAIVDQTLQSVPASLRRNTVLQVACSQQLPAVTGTWSKLGLVTQSLLWCVLEHADGQRADARIVLVPDSDPNFVKMIVEHNRVALDEHAVSKLFDPIFHAQKDAGKGLGLPIARRVVIDLGGQIGVQPVTPTGLRLWVRIPTAGSMS